MMRKREVDAVCIEKNVLLPTERRLSDKEIGWFDKTEGQVYTRPPAQ